MRKHIGNPRGKFAFSIYDFDGNDTMDAFYLGDCLRALNLNPTVAMVEKMGGTKLRKQKVFKPEEFLPIFAEVKNSKDEGNIDDFLEVLKLYDKRDDGTMIFDELKHILMAIGEYHYFSHTLPGKMADGINDQRLRL
ncbi:unnamed protein product [Notodromas monacha]|uniref:EF-hand domain-containing protein n=1 Tax=Notodromas monacha TaxID=399045 RepID=A0A7R9GJP9_9CRUS|nr:unnamed protein product [Notodromas monacha]CAG0925095.1 unnamed protein product [Notodromas monacha]